MKTDKPKILVFIDWYLPGYKGGGPIRSVANFVESLGEEYDFNIVTRDTDFGSDEVYPNITSNEWMAVGKAQVLYLSSNNQSKSRIREIVKTTDFDFIYFNSLFSYYFTLVPLAAKRRNKPEATTVLAPRGMLGAGALSLKSLKKQFFLSNARMLKFFRDVVWQASTELEKGEIFENIGPTANIRIAPNIARLDVSDAVNPSEKKEGQARFIFVSRIAEKKNLKAAVHFLGSTEQDILLHAYGPKEEEGYLNECEKEAEKYPRLDFEWKGSLMPDEVIKCMSVYHFFILPSLNENFGHIIIEALSAGLPVIISDQTPWRSLSNAGAGFDISLDDSGKFQDTIRSLVALNQTDYGVMCTNARNYARKYLEQSTELDDHRALFQKT